MGEVSGSLGDLGTFLPHIVGAITVVKMDPTGILTTFGLFYAFAGAFYGVPMAVQPMKAASAAVLIEPMDPAAIAGAGLVIGTVFLILGISGVVSRLARALPGSSGTIAKEVRKLLEDWQDVQIKPDLQSIPRVVKARKPKT